MLRLFVTLTLLGFCAVTSTPASIVDTALFGGRVLCLGDDGKVSAWSTATQAYDSALSATLSSRPVSWLASDGKSLWGLSDLILMKWSEPQGEWLTTMPLEREADDPIELLSLGSEPVVVYPTKIVRPIPNRVYPVPNLGGQLSVDRLRVLSSLVASPNVWFGTGQGEWGGHLVHLDTDTGEWSFYHDPLHYVTGITQGANGEVVVSWSMSHFMANTLVRIHTPETAIKREFPELKSRYLQSVAYAPSAKTLYGLEQNQLVELRDGQPHELADLGELPYAREPNAIGVAPGVLALFALADSSLLIVHKERPPFLWKNGELQPFPAPQSDWEPER